MGQFHFNPESIDYITTHRGVNASAKILDADGREVGTLDDVAEAIVARVHFSDNEVRLAFAAEARQAGISDKHGESMLISEYARQLLTEAEEKMLAPPTSSAKPGR